MFSMVIITLNSQLSILNLNKLSTGYLLLLYLIPYLLESLNKVFVLGFLRVVYYSNLLLFYRGIYLLCALYEADVALYFVLTALAVHLRQSGYYQCVYWCLGKCIAGN